MRHSSAAYMRAYMRKYRLTKKGRAYFHRYERSDKRKVVNRRKELLRTYGLTVEEYEAKLLEQSNGCAICGRPAGRLHLSVDHNHTTGQVRGLLCQKHNVAVAVLEYPELPALIAYLEKWNNSAHKDDPLKE